MFPFENRRRAPYGFRTPHESAASNSSPNIKQIRKIHKIPDVLGSMKHESVHAVNVEAENVSDSVTEENSFGEYFDKEINGLTEETERTRLTR